MGTPAPYPGLFCDHDPLPPTLVFSTCIIPYPVLGVLHGYRTTPPPPYLGVFRGTPTPYLTLLHGHSVLLAPLQPHVVEVLPGAMQGPVPALPPLLDLGEGTARWQHTGGAAGLARDWHGLCRLLTSSMTWWSWARTRWALCRARCSSPSERRRAWCRSLAESEPTRTK